MKKQTVDAGHGEKDMKKFEKCGGEGGSMVIRYLA